MRRIKKFFRRLLYLFLFLVFAGLYLYSGLHELIFYFGSKSVTTPQELIGTWGAECENLLEASFLEEWKVSEGAKLEIKKQLFSLEGCEDADKYAQVDIIGKFKLLESPLRLFANTNLIEIEVEKVYLTQLQEGRKFSEKEEICGLTGWQLNDSREITKFCSEAYQAYPGKKINSFVKAFYSDQFLYYMGLGYLEMKKNF